MVYEARYLARNCELKTRLGDIVSHLRHLSHLSQDKTKLLFSFFLILFNYAIQGKFISWLVNSALNCTWKPISHSSLRDSCDMGFCVQFNAEFPHQVMNFPIIFDRIRLTFSVATGTKSTNAIKYSLGIQLFPQLTSQSLSDRKSCGNTRLWLMFPQHFSFSQTFTRVCITQ